MRDPRRIAIVYPFINLDSVPSLCGAAVILAARGYLVDLYTYRDPGCVAPAFDDDRIAVVPALVPGRNRRSLNRGITGIHWTVRFLSRHRAVPYLCVIGADPQGLLMAHDLMARRTGVPVAYYSLELLLSHELEREEDHRVKARERALSRRAPFVVIQDDERAELLIRDNGLDPGRVIRVPNGPLGAPDRRPSQSLRERLGLPPDKRIVLHTGSIGEWTCTRDLVRSTRDWPEAWALVLHTRYRGSALEPAYMEELRRLSGPERVFFSTDPLPQKDYPAVVRSADVGVAFYRPQEGVPSLQDNIRHIGLSSGKVAYYLQAGVPILVNAVPSLQRLVGAYGCGEVASDPSATRGPIERILADRETYSRNAAACFEREFDFAGRFERVLAALEGLRDGRSGARGA